MIRYLKIIAQLVLAPSKGWEDVSASMTDPERLLRKLYFPLLFVASLTEFIRLFYHNNGGFLSVLELAIAMLGSFFVSFFIARIILSNYSAPFIQGETNNKRIATFVIYGQALLLLIEIIDNLIPTDLTLVKFLPLFVALILYRGSGYMGVNPNAEFRFLCIAVLAIIVVPIALFLFSNLL